MTANLPTGDELVGVLSAMANPIRLRILATLAGGRDYVSHLAREIGVSRPLLHMHLQRLEALQVHVQQRTAHADLAGQVAHVVPATSQGREDAQPDRCLLYTS